MGDPKYISKPDSGFITQAFKDQADQFQKDMDEHMFTEIPDGSPKLIECDKVVKAVKDSGYTFNSIDLHIVKSDHPKFTAGKYLFLFDQDDVEKEGYTIKINPISFPMDIHEVKNGKITIHKPEPDVPVEDVKRFVSTIVTNLTKEELEKYSQSCQEVKKAVEKLTDSIDAQNFVDQITDRSLNL